MATDETTRTQDVGIAAMLRVGSEDGFRELLRVYGPRIKWLLKDRFGDFLPDPDLSAVLNEALLKVFNSVGMFDSSRGSLGTWFWLIAANTARDMIRRELRHVHRDLEQDPYEPVRPPASIDEEETAASQQVSRALRQAIASLPDLQRKIIRADLACGGVASAAWLARKYSTTEASIYMSRKKARDNLRKEMLRRGHFQE